MTEHLAEPALSLRIGPGRVLLDPVDGSPLRFEHPEAPELPYLLQESADRWHTSEHRWGSGFAITSAGSGRWLHPHTLHLDAARDEATAGYRPLPALDLTVRRTGGDTLTETYCWTNRSDTELRITGLGLSLPLRDVYDSAADALTRANHFHVFTGGAWSWVLAEPMSGRQPLLGLTVRSGELWSYSIDSRSAYGNDANVRGHLTVQPTDRARNARSFGGQPEFRLAPGESWTLSWELGFHSSREEFLATTEPPARLDRLTTELGEPLVVVPAEGTTVSTPRGRTEPGPDGTVLLHGAPPAEAPTAEGYAEYGETQVELTAADGRRSRTSVLVHLPPERVALRRVRFLIDRQRRTHETAPSDAAFVPYDNDTGLTQSQGEWWDWTDGAERCGMAVLLQQVRLRGWAEAAESPVSTAELDAALHGWAAFARRHLVHPETGVVNRGSRTEGETPRLYNAPWLAHFFADQFRLFGSAPDLELAARILEWALAADEKGHLSIGLPEAVEVVSALLDGDGAGDGDAESSTRAERLRDHLLDLARRMAAMGIELPGHEVRYEQSMVAPLVSLLATAGRLRPAAAEELATSLAEALCWLRAFGGPQPHVRQRDIGIRHWDGFWFGRRREWGDTMPHHWSVLSAVSLTELPEPLRTAETDRTADAIFRANLLHFAADGSATCAYILPSCVNGVPAHHPDPLANDQDWALALWFRHGGELHPE